MSLGIHSEVDKQRSWVNLLLEISLGVLTRKSKFEFYLQITGEFYGLC